MNPIEIYHGRQPTRQERRAINDAREIELRAELGARRAPRAMASALGWLVLGVLNVLGLGAALWAVTRG